MKQQIRYVPRVEARAAIASVVVSAVLMAIKFVAYYYTTSAVIFSDALESIVNVIASIVAAYSLFLAHQPADEKHPYGHGKAEFLSATFEGGMIVLAAMVIAWHAIEGFLRRPEVQRIDFGLLLIVVAGAINGLVGVLLLRIGKHRSSATLLADGKHLLTDAVTSAGMLVALILIHLTGARWIDPLAALLVGDIRIPYRRAPAERIDGRANGQAGLGRRTTVARDSRCTRRHERDCRPRTEHLRISQAPSPP